MKTTINLTVFALIVGTFFYAFTNEYSILFFASLVLLLVQTYRLIEMSERKDSRSCQAPTLNDWALCDKPTCVGCRYYKPKTKRK